MEKRSDLIRAKALSMVGSPYVWGGTGSRCTPKYRKQRMQQYPAHADAIRSTCPALRQGRDSCTPGCKYLGKPAVDCAQLARLAYKAAGITLPSGASSQWRKVQALQQGPIHEMPLDKVCLVFRRTNTGNPMGHVGVYLGDGTAVDARGSKYGVMHRPLSSYPWTDYKLLDGMDDLIDALLPAPAPAPTKPTIPLGMHTLRYGHKGADVARMQCLLTQAGYPLTQDGIFGRLTREAVRKFQAAKGLTVDGIVGRMTWAALTEGR